MINISDNKRVDLKAFHKSGSALLVALLMMGILLTLTLGLSTLIVREIRQTSDIVSSGQAYFGAEAGMENALYDLAENLPGYESEITYPILGESDDEFLNYSYLIGNKGDKFPYFPDDQPVFLDPNSAVPSKVLYSEFPEKTYNVLPLNESVTIPLFTVGDDGEINNINEFLVQYYVNFETEDDIGRIYIERNGVNERIKLDDFDILRWKIFGNPCNDEGSCNSYDGLITDAISDFYPATEGVDEHRPVCIGTPGLLNIFTCYAPVIKGVTKVGDFTKIDDIPWNNAGFSFARQCFVSEVSGKPVGSAKGDVIMTQCNIDSFINTHTRNYLTLTNMVNPDIIGKDPIITPQYFNIYYRIVTGEEDQNQIVREFADIQSDGFSKLGGVRQSINAKLRLSSFLPVFNFSLYRTDTTTNEVDSPFNLSPGMINLNNPS